jgi:hypothetical protein
MFVQMKGDSVESTIRRHFSKMVSRAFREMKLREYGVVEDHYDLMEKIGEGTYGDVFKACRKVPPIKQINSYPGGGSYFISSSSS